MKKFLLPLFPFLFSLSAFCLTPPISPEERKAESDFILKGKIVRVECAPEKPKKYECGTETYYFAVLEADKTLKKPAQSPDPKTVFLHFSHMKYLPGCTGDQDHFHRPGETGTYYLRKIDDTHMRLLNWSTVEVTKMGDDLQVPRCPKGR